MTTKPVPLDAISIDGGTQARAEIHAATVNEYAEAMTEGETLPPAVVFFDGAQHHLADGFHRLHANRQIGAITMECEIRTGTLMDARLYAYGANRNHGLRRTAADKRKAVQGMLADFADMSDRAIAKHVGVSHPFVAAIRSPEVAQRQAGARDASAGKKAAQAPAQAPAPAAGGDDVESDSTPARPAAAPPPKVESDSTPPANPQAERMAELEQMATELLEDNKSMSAAFESNEPLVAALAENKQLRAEVRGLRERINGLMGEKNEAIRLMKSWKKKAEKAEAAAQASQA